MSIEITSIKINKFDGGKTKAFANIVINDAICISGIKIIDGINGLFCAMPSKETKKGSKEYKDIVYPINKETRKIINDAILAKFEDSDDIF